MAEEKKRILIFSHAMELGGAEKVLLGLLEAIDTENTDVDLFLMRHEGELLKEIPAKIHLLPEIPQYACLAVPFSQVLKKGRFGIAYGRFLGKRKAKERRKELGITGENDVALEYSHKYTERYMPEVGNGTYDLAISFLTPHYFVRDKVRAKKKIAWIHTDYSKVQVDRESQLSMWSAYDRIISISDQATKAFLSAFPELEDKIEMIPHLMPLEYIRRKSCEGEAEALQEQKESIRLLSIGRFSNAKNFDNIPAICRSLLDKGLNVRWYLIGYGPDEALIREKISEARMEEKVIILGKKENPYPYISACDLYVQPSRFEGKCVSVIEAQILGKPVVITAYPTSRSQVEDGFDGVIVPADNEGCAEGITALLRDPERIEQLKKNCAARDYSNSNEIQKLYALMEDEDC